MALNVSQRLAVSFLGNTQLPFLYETRTLQQHARFTYSPRRLVKSSTPWIDRPHRFAHSSASARETTDVSELDDDEVSSEQTQRSSAATRTVPSSEENAERDSSPLTPENSSQTTKISSGRRSFFRNQAAAAAAATASSPSSPKIRGSSAQARPSKKTLPGTTVTKWERNAFEKLYNEFGIPLPATLHRNEKRSRRERSSTEHEGMGADGSAVPLKSASMEKELSEVSRIMDEALKGLRNTEEAATSHDNSGDTDVRAGSMFPRLGETAEKISFEELEGAINLPRIVNLVVQREGEKIENVLHEAISKGVTDVGFWQLCQDRVFSLVRGLEEDSFAEAGLNIDVDLRTKTSESPDSSTDLDLENGNIEASTKLTTPTVADPAAEQDDIPEVLPRNVVIPPLYSKLLLLSFHLLRINFPTSPLLAQFWPTIQSHGRTSVLMGASTALYNELIILYGKHLNDLKRVILVLEEMELTGADPDMKTGQKIRQILKERGALPGSRKETQTKSSQDTNRNKSALKRLSREYRSIQRRLAEIQCDREEIGPRPSPNAQLLMRNE